MRHNPLVQRARPEAVLIDATPIESRLCNLHPLELEQVRRSRPKAWARISTMNRPRLTNLGASSQARMHIYQSYARMDRMSECMTGFKDQKSLRGACKGLRELQGKSEPAERTGSIVDACLSEG